MENSTEKQPQSEHQEKKQSKNCCHKFTCLKKVTNFIIKGLENAFYWLGYAIGKYPWFFILGCFCIVVIFAPGIGCCFYEETNPDNLWVPKGAETIEDKKWVGTYFPSEVMFESMIINAENVLTPQVIQAMLDIDIAVKGIEKSGSYSWNTICARLGSACWSNSLLELWSFDESTIRALTQNDILNKINTATASPVFFNDYNASQVLGKISYDSSGNIVGAKATKMTYVIKINTTEGSRYDETAAAWELKYLDIGKKGHASIDTVFYYAGRSFGDEGGGAISGDITFLSAGYIVVIVFVTIVLGRLNAVYHRIYVSLAGILCIGLAIVVSFGFTAYMKVAYGPVHSVLPFLLLGIGVDDMFVIIQALDNVISENPKLPIHEKIALALKHGGVSITVTSITDVLAFGIGATTILPALESFCIYACIGVLFTFLFQVTLFVACITLDLRRSVPVEENSYKNACCCCYIHKDYQANKCSQTLLVQTVFDKYYGPFLMKLPVKIVIAILAFAWLGVCIWGTINLKQEFDPVWFLPSDSYAYKYFSANDDYFPTDGISSNIYLGKIDYFNNFTDLETLYDNVKADQYVDGDTVDCWYIEFKQWFTSSSSASVTSKLDNNFPYNESCFYELLDMYINTPPYDGMRFSQDLVFTSSSNTALKASRFSLQHVSLADSSEEISAMDSLRKVTRATGFGELECFAYSFLYSDFESNKVIQAELYRNIGLAFLCVFIITLILLADLWACLMVCFCVIMTLVDVGGLMYLWGLTIDTVTCVNLILAIGLAVDYAAHVAHTFLIETGDRNERTLKTLSHIGPAVFYGGFSTFLAFILLAASTSYVFTTFFKLFFGVSIFGLFHGLVFLPIFLSWIGPSSYRSFEEEKSLKVDGEMKNNLNGSVISVSNDVEKNKQSSSGIIVNKVAPNTPPNELNNPDY